MLSVKQQLLAALAGVLDTLAPGSGVPAQFESPKVAAHGDLACTAAMQLAKPLKLNPRQLGEQLRDALAQTAAFARWVEATEIAGPGFLNIRLKPEAKQQVVREALSLGAAFGRQPAAAQRVLVEFVSANPTGPLHVGHGRQAALGDAICNLLATQGLQVWREFYYNDAGVQIGTLATSTQLRAKASSPATRSGPKPPTTATTLPTSRPIFWRARPCSPMTAASPPVATWTTSTAFASSRWPTCAVSRTWISRLSRCSSTTTTWNPACTPAAGSRRRSSAWSMPENL